MKEPNRQVVVMRFSAIPRLHRSGYTLVEQCTAVFVVGLLSVIVAKQFQNVRQSAVLSSLETTVRNARQAIATERLKTGTWPVSLEQEWFAGGRLPYHPDNRFGVPPVEIIADVDLPHPRDKVLRPASRGAFWYNASLGVFRARVPWQGDARKTLALYNLVNSTRESALNRDK